MRYFIEPVVMLAPVLHWLAVATVTSVLVGSGTSVFLHGLFFMTDRTQAIRCGCR